MPRYSFTEVGREHDRRLSESRTLAMRLGRTAKEIDDTDENSDCFALVANILLLSLDDINRIDPNSNTAIKFKNLVMQTEIDYNRLLDAIMLLGATDFASCFRQAYDATRGTHTGRTAR